MKAKIISFFISSLILIGLSCKKDEYPSEPVISFKSQSKSLLKQNGQDSMVITFSYTDGDGDIGSDSADNIFLLDERNLQIIASYRLPNDNNHPEGTYRKGEVQLIVYSGCCIYNDTTFAPCVANPNQLRDTMKYVLEVRDRSGKRSNRVNSDNLILECN